MLPGGKKGVKRVNNKKGRERVDGSNRTVCLLKHYAQ